MSLAKRWLMPEKMTKSCKILDLSSKSPDEIYEYLQAVLSVRYFLQKKGFKLKIAVKENPEKPRKDLAAL